MVSILAPLLFDWPNLFALASIFIYKALKTEIHKLSIGLTSAILIITGSFLIYDAYQISLEYHYGPRKLYLYFAGLQAAYQWLPLYIAVALISLGFGLIIAYKTLKTQPNIPSRIGNFLLPDRES